MTTTHGRGARASLSRLRPRRLIIAAGLAISLIPASIAVAVGEESGFEDDDGNLAPDPAGLNFDWNSFAPVTWDGTAPSRTAEDSAGGWSFTGLEDAQNTTSDSAFAGGTKQDDDCATVGTQKASNKDDLMRAYFASSTVDDHVYLNLAWVRIDQNTTSSSAHVAFEFNQSETACPAGSDSLVERSTANGGDMLIVYDFEGGAATPTIRLSRWIATGSCEVSSNSPPCWSVAQTLGDGVAEAAVNVGTTVQDAIAPPPPTPPVTLGDSEFGEAGIDLTDAGVFPPGVCVNFGSGFAVSRSSGNSSQAQMKDLVGPGEVNIQNCGNVIIHKETVPSPDPTDTTFDYTTTGGLDPATFQLKDGETQDYGGDVLEGDYSVTETDPGTQWMTSLDCSASETDGGSTFTVDQATRTVTFTLEPLDTIECTYTNTLQTGAILIHKDRKHAADGPGNHPHAGVDFTVAGQTVTTDANGNACVDGLTFGTYTVTETVPTGYVSADDSQDVIVNNTATCEQDPYVGETVNFVNTPLTNVTVSVDSQIDGGTASTINCDNGDSASTDPVTGDGSLDIDDLEPTTLVCTIVIDP
jgi:Prealbumin-like fold domain